MEQLMNAGSEHTGDHRENPLTRGVVRHDSHARKSGGGPTGNRIQLALVEGEEHISRSEWWRSRCDFGLEKWEKEREKGILHFVRESGVVCSSGIGWRRFLTHRSAARIPGRPVSPALSNDASGRDLSMTAFKMTLSYLKLT
ncbi:hypothetical protein PR048_019285 [Dryococelus australis]|uniref:Uncharacterized protein n=1 Tax=Dryococelus australis TaxID=614101 RepID=A0ABQ9H336_9NEOP|nr:hypothetical protein PR048_019285 [Dryococelus australis]